MGQGRMYTREFKLAVVREVTDGGKRPAQVCREHGVSDGVLWRWRKEYDQRGEAAFTEPVTTTPQTLEQRIAELERCCGQLAWENAALKRGLQMRTSGRDTP